MATSRGKKSKSKSKLKLRRRVGAAVPHINTGRALERTRDAFYKDKDPQQALAMLRTIESHGSMSYETLSFYLTVLSDLQDFDNFARVALIMVERSPEDPAANFMAASGAQVTMQPTSAIFFFEQFLKLAPQHPNAPEAAERLADLRDRLPRILDAFIDDLPKELPRIASIEKILHLL